VPIKLRVKSPDPVLRKIVDALKVYEKKYPQAEIEAYRQNSVSVRIRILNRAFAGKDRVEREEEVWKVLDQLPEDALSEISLLLLFTPDEAKNSFASFEFDDPEPSRL
jgi:hypothetical protein